MKSFVCELFSETKSKNNKRRCVIKWFAPCNCRNLIIFAFFEMCSLDSFCVSRRRRVKCVVVSASLEKIFYRENILEFFYFSLSVEGSSSFTPPARDLRRYFLFSLSRRQQTDKNGIKVVPFFTALSLSARARAHPERESLIAHRTHKTRTFFFLLSAVTETN